MFAIGTKLIKWKNIQYTSDYYKELPVPVAARCEAWVYGRSPTAIVS
jgi:hypothetical protein